MESCRLACEFYAKREYQKALELLIHAKQQLQRERELFHITRIEQNIAVCKSHLESRLDPKPFELIDRKGKSKLSEAPSHSFCSRLNYAIMLYHSKRYQEAIDMTIAIAQSPNKYYLKSLLLQLECFIKLENKANAKMVIEEITQISHYHLSDEWISQKSVILELLNTRAGLLHVKILQVPKVSGYEYLALVAINLNVMKALPKDAAQYLQDYSKLTNDIPVLFKPWYQSILYYYLSKVNDQLNCTTASKVYLGKHYELANIHNNNFNL